MVDRGAGVVGVPDGNRRCVESRCSGRVCSSIEPLLAMQHDNAKNEFYLQAESSGTNVLVDPIDFVVTLSALPLDREHRRPGVARARGRRLPLDRSDGCGGAPAGHSECRLCRATAA
jgi:hypothetical protein